jgi:hypothetical protein
VTRDVRVVDTKDVSKCSVVVDFTRYGYDTTTQQRTSELLDSYIVATKLTHHAAADLQRTVEMVCDRAYEHGHSDRSAQR